MEGPRSSRADVNATAASIDQQRTPKCTTQTLLSPRRLQESPAFSTRSRKTINVDVSTLSIDLENLKNLTTPKRRKTLGRISESSVVEGEGVASSSKAEQGPDVASSQASTGPAMGSMLSKISGLSSNEASSGEEEPSDEKAPPAAATPTKRTLFTLKMPSPVTRRSLRSLTAVTAGGSQDSTAASQQPSSPAEASPAKSNDQEPAVAPTEEGEEAMSADESDSSTIERFTCRTTRSTEVTKVEETEESSSEAEDAPPRSVVRRRSQATNTMPCIVESENEESEEDSDLEHVPTTGSKLARIESSEEEEMEEEDRCADQEQNGEEESPFLDVTEISKDKEESDGEMGDKESSDSEEEETKEVQETTELDESSQEECEVAIDKEKEDESLESDENTSDEALEIQEQDSHAAQGKADSEESETEEDIEESKEMENKVNKPAMQAAELIECDSDSTEECIVDVEKESSESDSSLEVVELNSREKPQEAITYPMYKGTQTKTPNQENGNHLFNCVVALEDVVKCRNPRQLELAKKSPEATQSAEKTPMKDKESPIKYQVEGAKLQVTPLKSTSSPGKAKKSPSKENFEVTKLQEAVLTEVTAPAKTKEIPLKEIPEFQKSTSKKEETPVKIKNSPFKDDIECIESPGASLMTPVKVRDSPLKNKIDSKKSLVLLSPQTTTTSAIKDSPIKLQGTPLKKATTQEKSKSILGRESPEIIELSSPVLLGDPINKSFTAQASKSQEKTKTRLIPTSNPQEPQVSFELKLQALKKTLKEKGITQRPAGNKKESDKPQSIPKPVQTQSIAEEVMVCNGGSSKKKKASLVKSVEKNSEQNTEPSIKKVLLGSLFQQAALFNTSDGSTARKSKKRKAKELSNPTEAKSGKTSFLGSAVKVTNLSEDKVVDNWQRALIKPLRESLALRRLRLQIQLKAMRNWQVTEVAAEISDSDEPQPEPTKKRKVAADVSESDEPEPEPRESTKKRKRKRKHSSPREEEPSFKEKERRPDIPQAAEDSDDSDAPQEVSFSAAKVSAFAALQEAAHSIQQEKEKKRERQRARQEQRRVEREAKEERDRKKAKAQAKGNRAHDKAQPETSGESAVSAKLPLSILHQLSERPTIPVAPPKPPVTPAKLATEKQSSKPDLAKKPTELEAPKSDKKKKKRKRKKKAADTEDSNKDPKPDAPPSFMPLQSCGPTQFGVTPLDVPQPTSHHKYAAWRDRNLYGDRVKRQTVSEAKKVQERLKWRNQGSPQLSGYLPYKP